MTPRYCRPCDVYWTGHTPCWCCGHPGLDTRRDQPRSTCTTAPTPAPVQTLRRGCLRCSGACRNCGVVE